MARRFESGKLVLASHNPGKLKEIVELLAPYGIDVVSAGALGLPEPEETETTFIGNARLKAVAAATAASLPALADDSGLEVMAIDRDPGIYSARWAGPTKDFGMAMGKVLDLLKDKDDRRARFVSALALAWPDGHTEFFRGEIEGVVAWPPRGTAGFGYDPIFQPEGHERTFGEMTADEKHGWKPGDAAALSHRARAFKLFVETCLEA